MTLRRDSAPATRGNVDELACAALRAEVDGAEPSAGVRDAVLAAAAAGERMDIEPQALPYHGLVGPTAAGSLAAYVIEAYLPWLRITA